MRGARPGGGGRAVWSSRNCRTGCVIDARGLPPTHLGRAAAWGSSARGADPIGILAGGSAAVRRTGRHALRRDWAIRRIRHGRRLLAEQRTDEARVSARARCPRHRTRARVRCPGAGRGPELRGPDLADQPDRHRSSVVQGQRGADRRDRDAPRAGLLCARDPAGRNPRGAGCGRGSAIRREPAGHERTPHPVLRGRHPEARRRDPRRNAVRHRPATAHAGRHPARGPSRPGPGRGADA